MDRWLRSALDYIPEWLDYQSRLSKRPGCVIAIAQRGRIVIEPSRFRHKAKLTLASK